MASDPCIDADVWSACDSIQEFRKAELGLQQTSRPGRAPSSDTGGTPINGRTPSNGRALKSGRKLPLGEHRLLALTLLEPPLRRARRVRNAPPHWCDVPERDQGHAPHQGGKEWLLALTGRALSPPSHACTESSTSRL